MERPGNHGQPNRNVSKPCPDPANDHRMKQMGLNDVKALAPQRAGQCNYLSRQREQIRHAEKIEVAGENRYTCVLELINQCPRSAVQYHRYVITEAIPQVAELFVDPDRSFCGCHDMTDPLR